MSELYAVPNNPLAREPATKLAEVRRIEAVVEVQPVKRDYSGIPLPMIATAIYQIEERNRQKDDLHAREMRPDREEAAEMRAFLRDEMGRKNAEVVPHDELMVTREQPTEPVKHISILRQLEGLVSTDDLDKVFTVVITTTVTLEQYEAAKKAIAQVVAADKIKSDFKVNATHLVPLSKYGDTVAKIIEDGYVHEDKGTPVLKIVPKQKALRNVTPLGKIAGDA